MPEFKKNPAPVALMMVVAHSVPPQCDHEALMAFQFFTERCAPTLLNHGSQHFWNELVLQASFVDESIKHLTIAASRLSYHKLYDTTHTHQSEQDPVFLKNYGKALSLLSQNRNPDPAFLLMACLVLILCDEFQDKSFSALQHLMAGRKILASYRPAHQYDNNNNTTIDKLGPIFARLESQTGEVYSQVRPLSINHIFRISKEIYLTGDIQHYIPSPPTIPWDTINETAHSLQTLAFTASSLHLPGPAPPTRFHSVPQITPALNTWLTHYHIFESQYHQPTTPPSTLTTLYLLRTYQLAIHILSRCSPFPTERSFDAYAGHFEHLSVNCGFLIRTTKLRLLPILFFIATRYRNASYRRRAVTLLKECGVDGNILAKVVMRVIRIEEDGVKDVIVCSDVPEEKRVRVVDLVVDEEGVAYVLRYRRMPYGEGERVETARLWTVGMPWRPVVEGPVHAVSPSLL